MMTHFFASGAGRVGLVAALLLVGVGRPAAGQNFSATRTDYITDPDPVGLVVADVSGDGRPDLITASSGSATVSVSLAAGTAGAFAARTSYSTPGACIHVIVADVNADGRPDLITVHPSNNSVGVRFAAGPTGSFSPTRTDYGAGFRPVRVAVADVNADGRPDLLTLSNSAVAVHLAAGVAGTFAFPGASYATQGYATMGETFGLIVADVNADGRPDLVTTDAVGGNVGVRLADATAPGAFVASRTDYAAGRFPLAVAVVDVNADGRPDLVTTNYYDSNVSVRLANAAVPGTFAATRTDYLTRPGPRTVAMTDVNADGRPDLVTVQENDNTVGVRLAAGPAGSFSPLRTDYATDLTPFDVAVVDVNADGRPDLVTVHKGGNTVGIRLNTGTLATGAALAAAAITLWPNPTGAAAAVHISLPAAAGPPATAVLLDARGRVLRPARALAVAGGQATGTLPTAGLPPGLYLVRLTSSAGTQCQRLVVE